MKKFLKSKIEKNETSKRRALEVAPPSITRKRVNEESRSVPIYPPLPVGPPPPDSPPKSLRKLKVKEKYTLKNRDDNVEVFDTNRLFYKIKIENNPDDQTKLNKSTTTCKYTRERELRTQKEERDLSHLRGMYTFCHNFQNAVCKRLTCKFVHASVSEEQQFYRTGILPPHTIVHHRNKKTLPQPRSVDTNSVAPPVNTPAMLASSMENPVMAPMPPASMMSTVNNSVIQNAAANSPDNSIWNDLINCIESLPGLDADKHPNCVNCLLKENRLIHAKNAAYTKMNSVAENIDKLNVLEKKDTRLNAILQFLMKPKQANQQNDLRLASDSRTF